MRDGTMELCMHDDYVQGILKEHGREKANAVVSPGLQSVTTPDAVSALEECQIQVYRRGVGMVHKIQQLFGMLFCRP